MELKQFIKRFFTIAIICVAVFILVIEAFFFLAPRGLVHKVLKQDWIRVSQRLEASKNEISDDTLYVGCSVAGQFLPFNNENQLTSTGTTYPIGNYFLIKNAIEQNRELKAVIYLSLPNVIGNGLARERTYGYFVKPFFTFSNRDEILSSKRTKEMLSQFKWLPFCQLNSFKIIRMDDFNYSDGGPRNINFLSPESYEWICRIDSLCKSNDVAFHLASPPVPISLGEESSDWRVMRDQVENGPIQYLVEDYLETIIYLDDSLLKDHIHWKNSYIEQHGEELISRIKASL